MGFAIPIFLTLVHMVNLLIELVCTRTVICASSGVTFLKYEAFWNHFKYLDEYYLWSKL